jgi:hypothetical protein
VGLFRRPPVFLVHDDGLRFDARSLDDWRLLILPGIASISEHSSQSIAHLRSHNSLELLAALVRIFGADLLPHRQAAGT